MRPSMLASLLAIPLLGGLGGCGATDSGHSDAVVSGGAAALGPAGGSDNSGGSSAATKAGSAGVGHGGSGDGGQAGAGGGDRGGAGGQGGAGGRDGAGGAGLACDAPRCVKLCEGGDCMCSCEGTAGSAGMAGVGGSSCATLNTARMQKLQAAASCSPELDAQCATSVTVPNQCACPTLVNSAQPEAVQAAQQAYDAWTQAGCGPYACGAACPQRAAGTCQAVGAAPGACTWSM